MTEIIGKAIKLLFGSFDQHALIEGASDIIVVKLQSGAYHSTPFLICFGSGITTSKHHIKIYINNQLVKNAKFNIDEYGYVHPMKPCSDFIYSLGLKYGQNTIKFQLDEQYTVYSQIYLYRESDKILVSDVDGTLTKSDMKGLYSNLCDENYLHQGYYELLEKANKKGYAIVWLTMRSLPLYKFSKDYISKYTKLQGALLTQPQQMLPALKKQLLKETGNIKANMMHTIRNLFPQYANPFIGGLGNRQNDAIAYRAAGIPLQNIFIINTESKVHHLSDDKMYVTYKEMSQNMEKYFTNVKRKSQKKIISLETKKRNSQRNKQFFLHKNSNNV